MTWMLSFRHRDVINSLNNVFNIELRDNKSNPIKAVSAPTTGGYSSVFKKTRSLQDVALSMLNPAAAE